MASSRASANFERFGMKLYSVVSQQNSNANVFLSPASIALAMSMCTAGARKRTLEQMLRTLEISSNEELVRTAEQVMQIFSSAANDKQVKLSLANRLYAQKAYKLEEDYLALVRKSFQADVQLADFVNESARVVQTINAWVEDQTNRLIQNLLSPNDVTADTRLILINCIYFKGTWQHQFEEHQTNPSADFYEENGNVSKIHLMYMKKKFAYVENKNLKVQVAHLPYKSSDPNTQFVFTVILPNKGVSLNEVEQKLAGQPNLIQQVLEHRNATTQELLLYLPKFKMEATFNLNDILIQMGMPDAFSNRDADFTGIVSPQTDALGICISKVIHKAFIDVNEQGSEAAAATAVVMTRCMAARIPTQPIEFKADRPFLFYIQEKQQNFILFAGKFLSAQTLKQ